MVRFYFSVQLINFVYIKVLLDACSSFENEFVRIVQSFCLAEPLRSWHVTLWENDVLIGQAEYMVAQQ